MKGFEKAIKHRLFKYAMYTLVTINLYGYTTEKKFNCLLSFVAAVMVTHYFIRKNIPLALLVGLFISTFVLGCGKILEGVVGISFSWNGTGTMTRCNDFTNKLGPYKGQNSGGWLRSYCNKGRYGRACDMSLSQNSWAREACKWGRKLGLQNNLKNGHVVDWDGKNIMTRCNDFTTHVGPYKDSRGGWLKNSCTEGWLGSACGMDHSSNGWARKACAEGKKLATGQNRSIIVDWKGKNTMMNCNDFKTSVGPYKDSRGGWLKNYCNLGYQGRACDMSLSSNGWARRACSEGKKLGEKLGNFKNGVEVDWEGKNIMMNCNDFTTQVGPYKNSSGGWLKNSCNAGYNANSNCGMDHSRNGWARRACSEGQKLGLKVGGQIADKIKEKKAAAAEAAAAREKAALLLRAKAVEGYLENNINPEDALEQHVKQAEEKEKYEVEAEEENAQGYGYCSGDSGGDYFWGNKGRGQVESGDGGGWEYAKSLSGKYEGGKDSDSVKIKKGKYSGVNVPTNGRVPYWYAARNCQYGTSKYEGKARIEIPTDPLLPNLDKHRYVRNYGAVVCKKPSGGWEPGGKHARMDCFCGKPKNKCEGAYYSGNKRHTHEWTEDNNYYTYLITPERPPHRGIPKLNWKEKRVEYGRRMPPYW